MFARAYYPGRSGQIALVPKEGEFITRRGTEFMHGSPWDYDVRIPFLLWGPGRVRKGVRRASGAAGPRPDAGPHARRRAAGRHRPALDEALVPGTRPPRAMLLLVLDGMRADYLDRFTAELPTLTRLRREGAAFDHARVTHAPSITSAGHATIATGTDPRLHGIVTNTIFDRTSGKDADIFPALSPRNLMSLALADVWNLRRTARR